MLMAVGHHWYIWNWGRGRCDDIRALGMAADSYKDVSSIRTRTLFCLPLYHQRLPKWFSGKKIHLPMQETQEAWVWSMGREDPLKKEMATHSSILAWKILRTEESGGLQPMGLQRVGHNWAAEHTHTYQQLLTCGRCSINNRAMNEWVTTVWTR